MVSGTWRQELHDEWFGLRLLKSLSPRWCLHCSWSLGWHLLISSCCGAGKGSLGLKGDAIASCCEISPHETLAVNPVQEHAGLFGAPAEACCQRTTPPSTQVRKKQWSFAARKPLRWPWIKVVFRLLLSSACASLSFVHVALPEPTGSSSSMAHHVSEVGRCGSWVLSRLTNSSVPPLKAVHKNHKTLNWRRLNPSCYAWTCLQCFTELQGKFVHLNKNYFPNTANCRQSLTVDTSPFSQVACLTSQQADSIFTE